MNHFSIIDTHMHLWDPARLNYPWLASVPKINRRFVLEDYDKATEQFSVKQMVFLQCEVDPTQSSLEAQWVTELAKNDPRIGGIVPWAPLEKGDGAKGELESLAANKLIKGIRRIIQFETDQRFCLQPNFIRGVQSLEKLNLSFDICIKGTEQIANTIELIKQCPNVKFILDHIGKPNIKDGAKGLHPWREKMRELARFSNVWCKMSGLVVEADCEKWTPADLRPFIHETLDCFGNDRVIFGGDWPVVLLAAPLARWIEVLMDETAALGESDRRKIFHDNAIDFYRLTKSS